MHNKRIITLGFLLLLAWIGMIYRVFVIQVVERDYYRGKAKQQSVRRKILQSQRGEIFDQSGKKLVANANLKVEFREGSREKTRCLKRVATHGTLAGQVLGNINHEGYGQLGLEYFHDRVLRGEDGWHYQRRDVANRPHPQIGEEKNLPVDGVNLVTSLDVNIQRIAERALERGVKKSGAVGGVAVVVRPDNGDVLAMANFPFYDPNIRSRRDLMGWKNKVISKVYEPGSTFKIITAAAALEEGKIEPADLLNVENGTFSINGAKVRDTKPLKNVTFSEALAYSSNIGLVKAAMRLKPEVFFQYIRYFGFGMKTRVELPAEENGFLKVLPNWNSRTQVTMAWGQELGVTPLQIAMACAAVANDGVLMKPRLILEWVDKKGKVIKAFPAKKVREVVSRSTAGKLREMMKGVVDYGTARRIQTDRYTIAGKTGTVEKINPKTGEYMRGRFHSSFVGMVPASNPRYVCLVMLNDPKRAKHGGACAAPVFREIMDRIISLQAVPLAKKNQVETPATVSDIPVLAGKNFWNLVGDSKPGKSGCWNALPFLSHADKAGQVQKSRLTALPGIPIPGEHKMPSLITLSLREALEQVTRLGMQVRYHGVGRVVEQKPKPNIRVKAGSVCVLKLEWRG